ncbi:DNA-binding HxlR family transcriptional regulator [Luteibacter sp. Sphag1AF]|uniref:winged helix-turn-helix transcriptional regulator n=1 Tax=Luteibacter sp. Sphag1AF TaxID=2587031 RepID=UPI00160CA2CE|nr:helix-turn-helix domain-containing protein [Luteibacter sp. Sphag1AF]MBB3228052.1 DNA-binding HxlR family transcriptional regulator [Luteibacter sp. Sphag1AF]
MARRKSLKDELCPIARALDVIGDRWSLLIVRECFEGTRRFGDFQRDLGVARNILTSRLYALVECGVLAVQPASDGSAWQEYVLTRQGENLFPVIVALRQWGERHLYAAGEKHSRLVCADSGRIVPVMVPRNASGLPLKPADAMVRQRPPAPRKATR